MPRLRALAEKHRRKLPLLILIVAAVAHGHFFAMSSMPHFRWDSDQYLNNAKNLAAGNGFRDETGTIEARRTPGYPLFLASFLRAGLGVKGVVIAQHLLAIAISVVVYFVTLSLTGDTLAAAIAGMFVAIDSGQIYLADLVMTEIVTAVLLLAAVALLIRFARRPSAITAAAGGSLIAAGVLVRPATIYLWIPLALWVLAVGGRRRLMATLAFTASVLSLPLLWTWRNYQQAGTPALSSIVGEIVYYWRAAGAVAMHKTGFNFVPLPFGGEEAFRREFFRTQRQFAVAAREAHTRAFGPRAASLTEAQRSDFDGRLGRQIIREHPLGAVLASINGSLHLLFDSTWDYPNALYGGWTRVILTVALFVSSVASVVLAIVGFFRLYAIDARVAWLLLIVLLYFIAVLSGPEHEQWRYRVPQIPIWAILVGCSVLPRRSGERAE
jgi:4-amino-4-deoxy-L-arabinose transferase-like glycosyltransferase